MPPARYPSLEQALSKQTPANRLLIKDFCADLNLTDFYSCSGYTKAVGPGRKHALKIYPGRTLGFATEDEARRAAGPGGRYEPSDAPRGTWWIEHPDNGGPRPKRKPTQSASLGSCPVCFMALPVSGVCGNC